MRKLALVFLLIPLMFLSSCATKKVEKVKENYSFLKEIYEKPDKKVLESVKNLKHERKQVLKTPKYVKIYRGSYRDEKGNVVEGGIEYLLIDDATPNTNF